MLCCVNQRLARACSITSITTTIIIDMRVLHMLQFGPFYSSRMAEGVIGIVLDNFQFSLAGEVWSNPNLRSSRRPSRVIAATLSNEVGGWGCFVRPMLQLAFFGAVCRTRHEVRGTRYDVRYEVGD